MSLKKTLSKLQKRKTALEQSIPLSAEDRTKLLKIDKEIKKISNSIYQNQSAFR